MAQNIIPFGKYKGRDLEEVLAERLGQLADHLAGLNAKQVERLARKSVDNEEPSLGRLADVAQCNIIEKK